MENAWHSHSHSTLHSGTPPSFEGAISYADGPSPPYSVPQGPLSQHNVPQGLLSQRNVHQVPPPQQNALQVGVGVSLHQDVREGVV